MIFRLPVAFAAGLAALAVIELFIPAGTAPVAAGVPGMTRFTPSLGQAAVFSTEWSVVTLARPLFRQSRRPVAIAAAVAVDDTLPRLSGIFFMGAGRLAVFDGTPPVVVSDGAQLGAYEVRRITPDSVLLRGPDGDVTVHPEFASGGGGSDGGAPAMNSAGPGTISPPVPDDIQPPAPPSNSQNVTQ